MWEKAKAFCLGSATIAWSYFLAVAGVILQLVGLFSDTLNDTQVQATLQSAFGSDPKLMGRILFGIAIITIIARMRTLWPKDA